MMHLDHSKKYVYGQCWSELEESDALWRIYSYGNHSIQIQTTDEYLKELIQQKNIRGTIRKIEYDMISESDLLKTQMSQLAEAECAYTPFCIKERRLSMKKSIEILIYNSAIWWSHWIQNYAARRNYIDDIKGLFQMII